MPPTLRSVFNAPYIKNHPGSLPDTHAQHSHNMAVLNVGGNKKVFNVGGIKEHLFNAHYI